MKLESSPNEWELYQFPTVFALGFHGCDKAVGEAILAGEKPHLAQSQNDYDWLGWGIYFWESNPKRALEFALERASGGKNSRGKIEEPFVLGAIINMGNCLNLSDSSVPDEVKNSYDALVSLFKDEALPLPENGITKKLRMLDCAVFELLHRRRARASHVKSFDTVRGTYREGAPLYPDTDLSHQDHTQICVRNTASILGYFRPIKLTAGS